MRAYRKTNVYLAYDIHSDSGVIGKGSSIYTVKRQCKFTPGLLREATNQIKRHHGVENVVITNIIYL